MALKGTAWYGAPLPACTVLSGMKTSSLCREGGSRILIMHHSPFDEVYVDERVSRETSTQYILITSAALKEFPQVIFSAKQPPPHPPRPHGSWLHCAACAQCALCALEEIPMLKGPGPLSCTVTKTEALGLNRGPGDFWADWIVAVWLSLQSKALPPQLWTRSP